MKGSFLYRLYHADKLLFGALVIYLLGLADGWRLDREQFPFLLYGMYSLKEKPKETYTANFIEVNGKQLIHNSLMSPKRELLISTVNHALPIDDSNEYAFGKWLLRYCSADSIKIYRVQAGYDANAMLKLKHNDLIFSDAE